MPVWQKRFNGGVYDRELGWSMNELAQDKTICFFQTTKFSYDRPSGGAEVIACEIIKKLSEKFCVVVLIPQGGAEAVCMKHAKNVFSLPAYPLTPHIAEHGSVAPVFNSLAQEILSRSFLMISLERVIANLDIRQVAVLGGIYYPHCKEVIANDYYSNIIVPSDFMRDCCIKHGLSREKIKVIYNGIDVALYPYDKKGISKEFLLPARSGWEKGYKEAIVLVRDLSQRYEQGYTLSVCVSRDSEFGREISTLSEKYGVTVNFFGWQSRTAMPKRYSTALCTLSLGEAPEGFGLTMAESLSCGTPVLSRKLGFAKDLVPENHGLLYIESFDTSTGDGCKQMMDKIAEKDSVMRGSTFVKTNYKLDKMTDAYFLFLTDIIEGMKPLI